VRVKRRLTIEFNRIREDQSGRDVPWRRHDELELNQRRVRP
jgi:hypothetical protein